MVMESNIEESRLYVVFILQDTMKENNWSEYKVKTKK